MEVKKNQPSVYDAFFALKLENLPLRCQIDKPSSRIDLWRIGSRLLLHDYAEGPEKLDNMQPIVPRR
ncbi:MAG TPA: hypothetical protein DD856_04470 [Sulfobacillus sp.]|nr:hypothetical protein [Sulfobacillus sp.]